jgi:hypothetical protein
LHECPVTPLLEKCLQNSDLTSKIEYEKIKPNGTELIVYKSPPNSVVRVTREKIPVIKFSGYEYDNSEVVVTNTNEDMDPYWLQLEKKIVIPNSLLSPQDIQNAETSLRQAAESQGQFFIIKVLGVSVEDILRLKYKFRNIDYSREEVEDAFSKLLQKGIISSVGKQQYKRYEVKDQFFKAFIDHCWNAHNLMKEKMERRWLYDDTVKSPWSVDKSSSKKKDREIGRRWLERSHDYKEANKMIIDFHQYRQKLDKIGNSSKDAKEKLEVRKQIKLLDDISITAYKALLNDHKKVIQKYNYLAEDLIEMTVYPDLMNKTLNCQIYMS